MVLWGAAAILFAVFSSLVPGVQSVLRTAPLGASQWLLAFGVAFLGTFWIEVRKWVLPPRPTNFAGVRAT
jgi:hypothetical protein